MKIKCEICGAERSMLTSHIRTSHNLTKEEYLKLYPMSKLISDERRETMKKAAKETTWVCKVCGYVHKGPEPPAECPVCHVGADKFEKVK